MATKAKTSKKEKYSEDEVITIELQNLLTPLAIIISGFMISASFIYAFNTYGGVGGGTTSGSGNVVVADDAGEGAEGLINVQTSIDDDPYLGDKDTAKIAIVEFSDFECPYCQRHWEETHAQLVENYVDTGEAILVFRDLPLTSIHPSAFPAAVAANCAGEQGGDSVYFKYHDEIFSNGLTSESQLEGFAQNIGLNVSQFNTCLASDKYDDEINADISDAASIGVQSTPGFVIGVLDSDGNVDGVTVSGAQLYETFESVILTQLDRS